MKIGYYVTPLKKHQQFELDFGNFGTIALTREAVIELIENLKAALEEHPAAQQILQRTGLCPECDSKVLPSQYCMMGHWCGERPAAKDNRYAAPLQKEVRRKENNHV